MRSMRAKLIVAGAFLVVSGAVAWALLTAAPTVTLTVRDLSIERQSDAAKKMGRRDYVVASVELSNASSREITYWGRYLSNHVDYSILTETPMGWKPPRQGFKCGTGLEQFTLAANSSISFLAVAGIDKPFKVAIYSSDGRTPSRLWNRLPRWLAQRLPWSKGAPTAVSAIIDVRIPGRLPVEIEKPLFKPPEATADIRQAAEKGDAEAQFKLAGRYWIGDGVEKNSREALLWYESAATNGHADAAYNLGAIYENGLSTTSDRVSAINWYRKASERGHKSAKERLQALASPEPAP